MIKVDEVIKRMHRINAVAIDENHLCINNMSMNELNKLIRDAVTVMTLLEVPLSDQDKIDLDRVHRIRRGELKKIVNADYTIINGDFYRAHPPLCFTTEPRVMTLEEVQQMGQYNIENSFTPYKTCLYERRGIKRLLICAPFWSAQQYEGDDCCLDIQYCFIGTDEFDNYLVQDYGLCVRCWTSKPTDEQREAVAWE